MSMITEAGAPIGILIFGFILEGVSIHTTVFGTTIVALIIIVLFMNIFNKDLDKMEETNET
ncbi:hypothetical protein [Candidatus Izimaplasma sp. HR1]|uniref:hypothetical protein n=1 Tax=Candidatus Izimoplasma sp. HR1 TaxID=1541959 RepID=UPI00056EB60E